MSGEIGPLSEWANTASVVALLFVILVAGYRRIWVWGYQLREAQAQRDHYIRLFHRTLRVVSDAGKQIIPEDLVEEEARLTHDRETRPR